MCMWFSPCSSPEEAPEKPLEGLLKSALAKIAKREPFREDLVKAVWGKAVGAKAARHSSPASFKRARLVVNVDGSSWLYELTLKKKEIIRKLGGKFGGKSLKEIQFRVGEIDGKE